MIMMYGDYYIPEVQKFMGANLYFTVISYYFVEIITQRDYYI